MAKKDNNSNILIKKNLREILNKNGVGRISKNVLDKIDEIFYEQVDLFCRNLKEKMDIAGRKSLDKEII